MKLLLTKTIVFLTILLLLFVSVSKLVTSPSDYRNYQWIAGFYEEQKDSLDAVYIGGSNTYAFWAAPLAWERYGIAVYPFACNSQPLLAAQYMIKEARKTQPNALYIISINGINTEISDATLHYMTDYLPLSQNKMQLVQELTRYGTDTSFKKQLEFLFPIIRYHSRWNELTEEDFHYTIDGLKGGSNYSAYLTKSSDISSSFQTTNQRINLPPLLFNSLDSLLNYCDTENLNVLFVTAPQALTNESELEWFNEINAIVLSRGYPVLNLTNLVDEMCLNLETDYYNNKHTNIHGAIKITDYLSQYLVEHYGFENKHNNKAYASWEAAYAKYKDIISPYVLDEELQIENRDYSLAAPTLTKVSVKGTTLRVSWEAVENAEGYRIYRKTKDPEESAWQLLEEVDADILTYKDSKLTASQTYTYTVIPYIKKSGRQYWGEYHFAGVSGTAVLDAPSLQDLILTKNGITISWESVSGADGYRIYRKTDDKDWILIEEAEDITQYSDDTIVLGRKYAYTVRAYYIKDGKNVYGDYNKQGLVWEP